MLHSIPLYEHINPIIPDYYRNYIIFKCTSVLCVAMDMCEWLFEWMSACRLMPSKQVFRREEADDDDEDDDNYSMVVLTYEHDRPQVDELIYSDTSCRLRTT